MPRRSTPTRSTSTRSTFHEVNWIKVVNKLWQGLSQCGVKMFATSKKCHHIKQYSVMESLSLSVSIASSWYGTVYSISPWWKSSASWGLQVHIKLGTIITDEFVYAFWHITNYIEFTLWELISWEDTTVSTFLYNLHYYLNNSRLQMLLIMRDYSRGCLGSFCWGNFAYSQTLATDGGGGGCLT